MECDPSLKKVTQIFITNSENPREAYKLANEFLQELARNGEVCKGLEECMPELKKEYQEWFDQWWHDDGEK